MKYKIKESVVNTTQTTKRVVNNAEQFVQATALLVTTGFAYHSLQRTPVDEWFRWVVTGSLVVVGLRAAVELIKFLDRE